MRGTFGSGISDMILKILSLLIKDLLNIPTNLLKSLPIISIGRPHNNIKSNLTILIIFHIQCYQHNQINQRENVSFFNIRNTRR